jgi:hypothetical protein
MRQKGRYVKENKDRQGGGGGRRRRRRRRRYIGAIDTKKIEKRDLPIN